MSPANMDLERSIFTDWERGDFSSAEWAHPDIEYEYAGGPEPGRWSGRTHMADAWRDFLRAWVDFRSEAEEYREPPRSAMACMQYRSVASATSTTDSAPGPT
jgi:hypothetical protein